MKRTLSSGSSEAARSLLEVTEESSSGGLLDDRDGAASTASSATERDHEGTRARILELAVDPSRDAKSGDESNDHSSVNAGAATVHGGSVAYVQALVMSLRVTLEKGEPKWGKQRAMEEAGPDRMMSMAGDTDHDVYTQFFEDYLKQVEDALATAHAAVSYAASNLSAAKVAEPAARSGSEKSLSDATSVGTR